MLFRKSQHNSYRVSSIARRRAAGLLRPCTARVLVSAIRWTIPRASKRAAPFAIKGKLASLGTTAAPLDCLATHCRKGSRSQFLCNRFLEVGTKC